MTYPPPHIPLWINSVRKEVIHSLIQLPPEGEKNCHTLLFSWKSQHQK